jgi:hypothetical protein
MFFLRSYRLRKKQRHCGDRQFVGATKSCNIKSRGHGDGVIVGSAQVQSKTSIPACRYENTNSDLASV